jgi:hypothetical protein
MAHFAEIDSDNKVLRVLVVDNSQEHRGQEFLAEDLGLGGTWIQTSYNSNIRGKFAGIGDRYDEDKDEFIETVTIKEIVEITPEAEAKATVRAELLTRLGITEDEAKILLGGN